MEKKGLPFYFAMPLRCFAPVKTPTGCKNINFSYCRAQGYNPVQCTCDLNELYNFYFDISYFIPFFTLSHWTFFLVHGNFYFTFNLIDLCVLFLLLHSFTPAESYISQWKYFSEYPHRKIN